VSTHRGAVIMKDLRNNDRFMLDDLKISARFYEPWRAEKYVVCTDVMYERALQSVG
jgi:hypothetical protein